MDESPVHILSNFQQFNSYWHFGSHEVSIEAIKDSVSAISVGFMAELGLD